MATPQFQIQGAPVTIQAGSPNTFFFPTKDTTGAPVDVHTGYSISQSQCYPLSDNNVIGGNENLSSVGTYTFSTTGVTWTLTEAETATLLQTLATLHMVLIIALSNDSSATKSLFVQSNMTLNTGGGAIVY